MANAKQEFFQRLDVDAADFENMPAEVSEDQLEWEKFIDEMSDGIEYAKITVYRVPTNEAGMPQKRQMAFLFDCMLNDYTFSQLCAVVRDKHGSGVYRFQVRDKGGTLRKNKQIAIESPKVDSAGRQGSDAGDIIGQMSRAFAAQNERFDSMLRGPQVDPIDQMTKMMGAMGAMMAAMGLGSQNQPPPKTPLENMMEMKMMKEIAGDLFSSGDGQNSESGFWSAIGNVATGLGGPLMAAIAQGNQTGELSKEGVIQLPAPVQTPDPTPDKAATPQATGGNATEEQMKQLESMKLQMTFLLNQAKSGVSAKDTVAFVVAQLGDDDASLDRLEDFLDQEKAIDQCIAIVPEIANHRDWFNEWRLGMLHALDQMLPDEERGNLTIEGETDKNADTSGAGGAGSIDASDENPDNPLNPDEHTERNSGDEGNP